MAILSGVLPILPTIFTASGAIDAAGSFEGIYQSAVLAYGSDLIKDPPDAGRFASTTALQAIEMAVHAAAYVDLQNLLAGRSTPVLSTHLMMTVIIYPIFGVLMSGFIIVAARERALGALWMGWIGVIGALAHGAAGLLMVGFNSEVVRQGFPLIMLVMIWALIAALMPRRALASMSTQPT